MKIKLFLLLLLFFSLMGCGEEKEQKNGEEAFLEKLEAAPTFEGLDMPEWLKAKIEEIHEPRIGYIKVYEGLFEGQEIYYIYIIFSSCIYCDIYYKDGQKVILKETISDKLFELSKDWKVILELDPLNIMGSE